MKNNYFLQFNAKKGKVGLKKSIKLKQHQTKLESQSSELNPYCTIQ